MFPWITGDPEDPCLGFNYLLHYQGNAIAAVHQASSFDTPTHSHSHSHSPPLPVQLQGYDASVFLPSHSNHSIPAKLSNHSSNCLILSSIPANSPHQFKVGDEKPQIGNPQLEQHLLQPPSKPHYSGLVLDHPFTGHCHDLLLRKQHHPFGLPPQLLPPNLHQNPMMAPKQKHHQHFPLPVLLQLQQQQQQQQQHQHQHQHQQLHEQDIKNQLFKAADLIFTGNFSLALEILARLNHQLPLPPNPLFRVALYAKEALQMLLLMGNPVVAPLPKTLTPCDVVNKMNAYKLFSEVSPIAQFVNFTCTQATLEALDDADADAIHIIDFDIGCGVQWASFIQELPLRKRGAPSLRISALAPLSTSHPFELGLIRENLLQFANDIGIVFELQVINLDLFDPSSCSMPNFRSSEDEAIAVNIPIWASSNRPSILPPILEFIKQRSPKIVVSFDRGFDCCDVPFPQHLVHILDSCANLLESLEGLNVAAEIVSKIEKFFVQPRIENTLLARVHFPEKMPHWKNLFNSAGFSPVQFSNFTETQADYVVKKIPGRGFNVEKRQAALVLSWRRCELVAASAWRC